MSPEALLEGMLTGLPARWNRAERERWLAIVAIAADAVVAIDMEVAATPGLHRSVNHGQPLPTPPAGPEVHQGRHASRLAEVVAMRNEGLSQGEIAERLGVSQSLVSSLCREAGVGRGHRAKLRRAARLARAEPAP